MQLYSQNTPVWLDVRKIVNDSNPSPVYNYTATLHMEKIELEAIDILTIDLIRDYVTKIADTIRIQLRISLGDYIYKLYPNRHNLEITITRSLISDDNLTRAKQSDRYKAVFIPNRNQHFNLSSLESIDEFSLNNRPPVIVEFQLLDRTLEPLRTKTLSGVFSKVDIETLIRAILAGESAKITVDGKPGIDALDVVEPHNKDIIQQIVFPNQTPVLSVPTYIQENHKGVYNTGIGTYFQKYNDKRTWFIYPLYSLDRFANTKRKLVIYAINGRQFSSVDRTYSLENNVLKIITTGERMYVDDAEVSMMEEGIGFRQVTADEIINTPFIDDQENGPIGDRNKINTEVIFKDRKDGLNYAPMSKRMIANNLFAECSNISVRLGSRLDLTWYNSDPDLIYPGMPCKYFYLTDDKIKEANGVVLFTQTLIGNVNPSQPIDVFTNTSSIVIFIERLTDLER